MRILIVGCGYVGLRLGAELVRHGHSVSGLSRSACAEADLKSVGILPLVADITVPGSLFRFSSDYDWVVLSVSASGGGADQYEQVYLHGTRHLVSWLSESPPSKFVFTGSTSVYGQTDGSWVDENSPTEPLSATAQLLVRTEQMLLRAADETGLPAVILRVAGIYGPGRASWIDRLRNGNARIAGADDCFLNMIHRDDVAGAIHAALVQGQKGRVYNAVDDLPVTRMDLLQWLSLRTHKRMPPEVDTSEFPNKRSFSNKRVCNRRIKIELGYQFQFPTYKEGYESVLSG